MARDAVQQRTAGARGGSELDHAAPRQADMSHHPRRLPTSLILTPALAVLLVACSGSAGASAPTGGASGSPSGAPTSGPSGSPAVSPATDLLPAKFGKPGIGDESVGYYILNGLLARITWQATKAMAGMPVYRGQ